MSSKKYNSLDRRTPKAQYVAVSPGPLRAELRIEALVAGGRGIGRVDGRVWLVEGALPGDLVRAEAERVGRGHVEARVTERLEGSPSRRPPPCPVQGACGGCPWMTLDEAEQRDWKRRLVVEAIERVGKLSGVEVGETAPSDLDLGYRNKVELTFGREGDGRVLGFHPSGSGGRIVDVERCLLQGEGGRRVLESTREFFLHGPGRGETALDDRGDPPRVVIRESRATGKILVALRTGPGPLPSAVPFARHLMSRHPEVGGVVRLFARPGRRGGSATETLAGDPWIEEALAGTLFRLPAATFFQVNTGAAERLAQVVMGAAATPSPNRVLDLYGGVGVFAIALAREGARATVVEADRGAVECGRAAVAAGGIEGVEFAASDVAAYLRSPADPLRPPDLVVADPPRTGLGPGVADAIVALASPRIILVSCDAPTLGRDLRRFVDRGYAIRRVVPVDLFPQTASVEAVAELHRVP